jgi:hypothetical protein
MNENIDDLTIAFSEDQTEKVRELNKHILSKGAWSTIIFRYQEWNATKEEFGPAKYSIRRYQKRNNQYWQKSKFNISSDEQAKKIIAILSQWVDAETGESELIFNGLINVGWAKAQPTWFINGAIKN